MTDKNFLVYFHLEGYTKPFFFCFAPLKIEAERLCLNQEKEASTEYLTHNYNYLATSHTSLH